MTVGERLLRGAQGNSIKVAFALHRFVIVGGEGPSSSPNSSL